MWKSLLAKAKSRSQHPYTPAACWKTGIAALALGTLGALPAAAQLNYPTTVNTVGTPSAANPGFLVTSQTWKSLTDNVAYPSGVVNITSTFVDDPTLDDDNSSEQTLGFNFPLTGGLFNKVIVNTNGYLKLGNAGMTPPSATVSAGITYSIWNSVDVNMISAFGTDLIGQAEFSSPQASIQFFSNADSAVIEWSRVHDYAAPTTQYREISFQIKLFPSGVVKLEYGPTIGEAASAAGGRVAQAGIKAVSASQVYRIQKAASGSFWQTSVPANTVYTNTTGGNGTANQQNYRRNVIPTQTAAAAFLAAGLTREYRMTPTVGAVFQVDATVNLYSLGEVPKAGGPHIYRARISNKTNVPVPASSASLTITGANPTGVPLTAPIPVIGSGATVIIDFPGYTLTNTGAQVATVTLPSDADNTDNSATYNQNVTEFAYSYNTPSLASSPNGVGFNGGVNQAFVGEFVARFRNNTGAAKIINQANIDFQAYNAVNGQAPYRVLVFAADGLDDDGNPGAPGTLLYASDTLLSPILASTSIIPILPTGMTGLSIPASTDFFVGLRQVGPKNLLFSVEPETPVRDKGFFSRASLTGNPTTPFTDFGSIGSPFRFLIGVDLLDPTPAVPNCVVLTNPANLATNVPTRGINGRISFTSGGGAPTGFNVYLSTSQADVLASAPAALVSANQQSIVFRFAPLGLAYNQTYHYKVVARNQNGDVSGPLSVGGSCPNEVRSFTTQDGPPLNNDCVDARLLTVGAVCVSTSAVLQQTTKGADEDVTAGLFDPLCVSGDLRDVWYTFNSGSSRVVNLTLTLGAGATGASALGAALYPNNCGVAELQCIVNAAGTTALTGPTGLALNTTYRIRVWTIAPANTPGRFDICLTTPPPLVVNSAVSTGGAYSSVLINNGGTLTMTSNIPTNNLTILDGGTLITNGFVASGNAFSLQAGGTLEVSSPDGITKAGQPGSNTGSIVFTSRAYSSDATYRYGAIAAGVTGNGLPSTVRGIETVNGSGFTTLSSPINVRQMVRLGDADLAIGGSLAAPGLKLLSNATHTAMIVNTNTATLPGRVVGTGVAMRYISPSLYTGTSYHHLCSPVLSTTVNDMSSGSGAGSFQVRVNPDYNDLTLRPTLTLATFPNVFNFDGSAAALSGVFSDGYQSPAALTSPMLQGIGYSVRTAPISMSFVGSFQQGITPTRTVSVPVTRDGTTEFGNGWNLIGNAYASPIDWDLVPAASLTAAGLASAIYVQKSVDGAGGAAYSPYINGVGPVGTELLAMGQAFFIQKTSAAGSNFIFTNACRLTQPANPQLNRRVETRPLVELSLLQNGQAAKMTDRTYVYFENGATTDGNDDRFDAQKLPSTGVVPNLFTRANGTMMSINGQPALTSSVMVPVAANVSVTGTYVLNADKVINIPNGIEVFLVDALTGTTQNLSTSPLYTFQATAGDITPRFTLQFRGNAVTGVTADRDLANQLNVFPNPTSSQAVRVQLGGLTTEHSVALTLVSALGQVVARQQVAVTNSAISTELDVRSLAKGLYTLRVVAAGRSTTRTIVVQ